MSQYAPPLILVNTWLQLISSNYEPEATGHAKKMINRNFGSVDLAIAYLEQKQIKLKKVG
jgi:superoxide dismutase